MSASLDSSIPTSRRAMFLSASVASVAIVLYLFAVQPCQMSISKARAELEQLEAQSRITDRDLKDSPRVKSMIAEAEAARRPFMDALLTPLLESWAMRAKSMLDPLADDVGLKIIDYAELPVRALPLPKPVSKQLYARRPISVSCRGSYAEIASFVLRVEKMLPFVSLEALNIKAQPASPEVQTATIVFEWPAKGTLSTDKPGVRK